MSDAPDTPTDLDRIGGLPALQQIMTSFMDRVFDDRIIGFLFIGRDKARITQLEMELAANTLGRPTIYTGRNLGQAHRPLQINRGHFRRRLVIFEFVLREHEVPADIVERWMSHQRAMEKVVTNQLDCGPG